MLNLIPSAILILGLAIFLIMDFSLADRATAAQLIKQGGIWHPEVRPKAIYDAGNTYCTWVDPDGHVGVSRIIHNSGEVRHRKVGQTQVNDHTVPSILIRQPDRRLVLFWTKHNGDSVYRRTSDTPHGIKSFGEVKTFSAPRSTYTQNVQLEGEGNRIYVFYRSRNRWLYRTSDDGAESFSEPTVMLPDYSDKRPRIQVVSDGTNRIHITDGAAYYGVWHFFYEDGAFFSTDGRLIREKADLPIESRDELTLIYDHRKDGNHHSRGCDLALDSTGYPVATFTVRVQHRNDHRHQYARWTGSEWVHHEVAQTGASVKDGGFPMSGGIYLNHKAPSIVYSARQTGPGVYQIFKCRTPDGGATWENLNRIEGRKDQKNFRPNYVRNSPIAGKEGVEIMWNSGHVYDGRTDYDTDIWAWPQHMPVSGSS